MSDQQRVNIVRLYMLCAVATAACLTCPILAWYLLPLPMLAWFGCCQSGCVPCDPDMDMTRDMQVDLSGMSVTGGHAGDGCTCTDFNGTWVTSQFSSTADTCEWRYTFPSPLCFYKGAPHSTADCDHTTVQAVVRKVGANHFLDVQVSGSSGCVDSFTLTWRKSYGATAPDCGSFASESATHTFTTTTFCCSYSGAAALVTAL